MDALATNDLTILTESLTDYRLSMPVRQWSVAAPISSAIRYDPRSPQAIWAQVTRHLRSPLVTRGHHPSPEVTTRHLRSPLAARSHHSPLVTRGHHSAPQVTTRHPTSPLATRGHYSSPEVTSGHQPQPQHHIQLQPDASISAGPWWGVGRRPWLRPRPPCSAAPTVWYCSRRVAPSGRPPAPANPSRRHGGGGVRGSVSCFIAALTAILGLVTPITCSCSSVLFWGLPNETHESKASLGYDCH